MKVAPPGDTVTVQVPPEAGRSFSSVLPFATEQDGCVIIPIVGAVGVAGWAFITTLPDAREVHDETPSVTVNVYVPVANPEIVELVPIPVVVVPPGLLLNVHVPDAGRPLRITLPVASVHVG